jgi:hypothetical protein
MATLTVKLVTKNGAVDQEASEQQFRSDLSKYITESETQQSTIADTISAIFDAHKGEKVAMPVLASMACQKLNAQPSNWKALETLALEYIRANKDGDDSLFVVVKGAGGGCGRRADLPVPAPAAK